MPNCFCPLKFMRQVLKDEKGHKVQIKYVVNAE